MIQPGDTCQCLVAVDAEGDRSRVRLEIQQRTVEGEETVADDHVLVQIRYSSINYKDALAATGHPGVAKRLPLVPGIDAVGEVVRSKSSDWSPGDRVIINTDPWGTEVDGGWRQAAWVPSTWLVRSPDKIDDRQIACLGTAGITAAWCVDALQQHDVLGQSLPIVVTGATGGVGSLAIEILAKRLGQAVVAVTGKVSQSGDWLKELGAQTIVERTQFVDSSGRPLLSAKYAGAVDTVGSQVLSTVIRSLSDGGCAAACGLAGGADLDLTVYPFILRGAVLYGIDCTRYSQAAKATMWNRLANEWLPEQGIAEARVLSLEQVHTSVDALLDGTNTGRIVVDLQDSLGS